MTVLKSKNNERAFINHAVDNLTGKIKISCDFTLARNDSVTTTQYTGAIKINNGTSNILLIQVCGDNFTVCDGGSDPANFSVAVRDTGIKCNTWQKYKIEVVLYMDSFTYELFIDDVKVETVSGNNLRRNDLTAVDNIQLDMVNGNQWLAITLFVDNVKVTKVTK